MFCIHCGKEILNGTTFCAFCGKPQQSTPNPQINPVSQAQPVPQAAQANPVPPAPQINPMPAPSPAPQKKKSRRGFVIGLVAAIVAVIAIAVGVGVIVYSNSPARRLQQQLDLGARYLSELDYEQAIAAYEAALEIDPKSAEAYGGLIDAYSGMGDADGLLRVYAAAKEQLTEEELSKLLQGAGAFALEVIGGQYAGAESVPAEETVTPLEPQEISDDSVTDGQTDAQNNAEEELRLLAEDVDVNTLPESLKLFFDGLQWGYYSSGTDTINENRTLSMEYDYRTATEGYSNLMACIVSNPTCASFSLYPFSDVMTEYWGMPGDPPLPDRLKEWQSEDSDFDSFAEFDRQAVDWVAENIFNLSKEDIETLIRQAEEDHLFCEEGNRYLTLIYGVGGPGYNIEILSAKTYQGRYYLTYEVTLAPDESYFVGRYYAEGEFKEIDGQTYWTLYRHSNTIPEDMQ